MSNSRTTSQSLKSRHSETSSYKKSREKLHFSPRDTIHSMNHRSVNIMDSDILVPTECKNKIAGITDIPPDFLAEFNENNAADLLDCKHSMLFKLPKSMGPVVKGNRSLKDRVNMINLHHNPFLEQSANRPVQLGKPHKMHPRNEETNTVKNKSHKVKRTEGKNKKHDSKKKHSSITLATVIHKEEVNQPISRKQKTKDSNKRNSIAMETIDLKTANQMKIISEKEQDNINAQTKVPRESNSTTSESASSSNTVSKKEPEFSQVKLQKDPLHKRATTNDKHKVIYDLHGNKMKAIKERLAQSRREKHALVPKIIGDDDSIRLSIKGRKHNTANSILPKMNKIRNTINIDKVNFSKQHLADPALFNDSTYSDSISKGKLTIIKEMVVRLSKSKKDPILPDINSQPKQHRSLLKRFTNSLKKKL